MSYKMVRWTEDIREKASEVLSEAFAKNGVKKDFGEMYPRVFAKGARQLSDHFAAFSEDGEIHGCISNCEMIYHIGDETLKISSSGNVAVAKEARGKGLMTIMFDAVDKSLHEDNFDLSYLHGARTRYQYFGYELCGVEYRFLFQMADLSKHYKHTNMFEFIDLSTREELLDEAIAISNEQKVHIERRADELLMVYRARWRKPIGVFKNGEFFGSFAFGENGIKYLSLKDYNDFAEMVYEFLLTNNLNETEYYAPDYNKQLMKNCMTNCSSFEILNPANFKIINFEKVVKAFLQLKADNEKLCDGEFTLESDLFGKFKIAVKDGKAMVEKFEGEAKFNLKGYEVYDFLFNFTPNSYGEYDAAAKAWLPLPINAPYLA